MFASETSCHSFSERLCRRQLLNYTAQDRLLSRQGRSRACCKRTLCQASRPKVEEVVPGRGYLAPHGPKDVEAHLVSPVPPQRPPRANDGGAEVLIELEDVHKAFGSKKILQGTTVTIRRGEAVGIIGASGTGKSTTLRIMAGLLMPDQGEVRIKGRVRHGLLGDDPEVVRLLNVGMVFQNGALFDSLTVGENVGFMLLEHTRLPHARINELVADSLASVGLSGVEKLMPSELSGGMRKRVALARAIILDDAESSADQVIMYDEPTAGLDPVASTVVEDLIRDLHNRKAAGANGNSHGGIASYIVVTHQQSTIRRAVDRIIFLHAGKVVWHGTVQEFDTTAEPIVVQFRTGALQGPIKYE